MDVLSPFYVLHVLWLLPAILVLYFLKLRRDEVLVSSSLLWTRLTRDLEANAPFQRLTRNLLLFLQLLIAAILIVAAMRPVQTNVSYRSQLVFVLIDSSGSMQAKDGIDGTRLDEAKRLAHDVIDKMARDDRAMIISVNERARTLSPVTSERRVLEAAIDGIQPTDMATEVIPALRLVQGYTQAERPPRVVLISDGRFATDVVTADDIVPDLHWIQVGQGGTNLAILALSARRDLGEDHNLVITATVGNFGDRPAKVALGFSLDGQALAVRELDVPAGRPGECGQAVAALELPGGTGGLLHAEIPGGDVLPADDHAYLALAGRDRLSVTVVSDGDFFIESVLATDESLELSRLTVDEYRALHDGPDAVRPPGDLVIFDGWAPTRLLHPATLFLGACPPLEGFSAAPAMLEAPRHLDSDAQHPVTRYVQLGRVAIARALHLIALPRDARVLWESREGPLLVAVGDDRRRVVVSAVRTTDSDWVTQRAWPIFMKNAVDWLAGDGRGGAASSEPAGAGVALRLPQGHGGLEVTAPDGTRHTLLATPGSDVIHFAQTQVAGFYRVQPVLPEGETPPAPASPLAVTFPALRESDPSLPESLDLAGRSIAASTPVALLGHREVWRPLVWGSLVIALVEWWWWNRRRRL